METINLRELRRRLPRGSIVRIAKAMEISAKVVSEVLNKGWHIKLRNRVCYIALSILEESRIKPDVIKHAQELGLTSHYFVYPVIPVRKKKLSGGKMKSHVA